jgi:hypothetical protein
VRRLCSVGESKATCVYRLAAGQHIIVSVPLTEGEVASYRHSPETFFGVVNHVGKKLKHPLDAYDFVYGSYSQSPKERLLRFMAGWPDLPTLQILEQPELAKRYCARMAEGIWARTVSVSRTGAIVGRGMTSVGT